MENGGAEGRSSGAPSSWGFWELASWPTSSPSSSYYSSFSTPAATCFPPSDHPTAAGTNADSLAPHHHHHHHHHLTCLKLGKRQYCGGEQQRAEESAAAAAAAAAAAKRERAVPPPRCQVDGCSKALVAEKEYHRRHKVCEPHSKAPRVLLLGLDQRFCQQCSRFHVISEFDDAKRSCRRRLAGHNERRRKSSADSIARSHPAAFLERAMSGGMAPFLPVPPGCALSLLSSKASPWIAAVPDLPSRSSAALNELIAENRAALLARQLFTDPGGHAVLYAKQQQQQQIELPYVSWPHQQLQQAIAPQAAALLADGWSSQLPQPSGSHVTLDLMQMPGSFEIVSARAKSKGEEEECGDIWKSLAGTHVM